MNKLCLKRLRKEIQYLNHYKYLFYETDTENYLVFPSNWGNKVILKFNNNYPFSKPECLIEEFNSSYFKQIKYIFNKKLSNDLIDKILIYFKDTTIKIPNITLSNIINYKQFIYTKFSDNANIIDWIRHFTFLFITNWSASQKIANILKEMEDINETFNLDDKEYFKFIRNI